jgi:tetratricopeptide (TPR) repeat protein
MYLATNMSPLTTSRSRTKHQQTQEALQLKYCNHALHFLPDSSVAYSLKGFALLALKRYDEALNAYDESLRLGLSTASVYKERGDALYHLQRYDDALLSYKEAFSLQPDFVDAYKGASQALREMAQENIRLADFYDEQARKLSQDVRNSSQEVSE